MKASGVRAGTDAGMSLVEVIVAILLLAIFSASLLLALNSATGTSTDSRARIAAAGLASRELDLVGEMIAQASGSGAGLVGTVAVNPHLDPSVTSVTPGAEYPFVLDGEGYRIVRSAQLRSVGTVDCSGSAVAAPELMATLVTVEVTWGGMRPGTKPHVVSRLFSPGKTGGGSIPAGQALIAIHVEGLDDGTLGTDRAGVAVSLSGPGVASPSMTTDGNGCAFTFVTPPAPGGDYTAKLLGGPGGARYVTMSGDAEPTGEVLHVLPGDYEQIPMGPYDQAGSVTVEVVDWANWADQVATVQLLPSTGGDGGTKTLEYTGDPIVFEDVYPGVYRVSGLTGSDTEVVYDTAQVLHDGANVTKQLVKP
jgi:prepilin-type N-terminal cleavage/methylation domain-containing protein